MSWCLFSYSLEIMYKLQVHKRWLKKVNKIPQNMKHYMWVGDKFGEYIYTVVPPIKWYMY